MDLQPYLLDDAQMRSFIANGYLVLNTDFPQEFHDRLNARLAEVMEKEGNWGNNILPRVPEVNEVFRHPAVRGALTSVVGPDYIMHPHRHCHYTFPGRKVQSWHKDSYWGYQKVRNHHNWWAMIFYYPQTVDTEMGPSGILEGTQFYAKRPGDESEREIFVEGAAGTFALIHYDLWHRGGANLSQRNRAMMKFQFVRMNRPTAPAWNNQESDWRELNGEGPPHQHEELWREQWRWHRGETGTGGATSEASRSELVERLRSGYEPHAVDAAYRLAAQAESGLDALVDGLRSGEKNVSRNAGYGMSVMGEVAIDPLVASLEDGDESARTHAAFALGELGIGDEKAAAALAQACRDEAELVRRAAVESLGMLPPTDSSVSTLIDNLGADEDDQVRFTTALSLQRIGPAAAEAVPALEKALKDENRYVRANAVDALRRIGTPEAVEIAFEHLSAQRWCTTTTPEDTF